MNIEIINTGTELLLGTTLNTHGAWIGQELLPLGLRVDRQVTVPDGEAIRDALEESIKRSDIVIVTGGIGPTSDDITREITAEVMGLELIEDEAAIRSIQGFFDQRSREMPESNRKQAQNPCGADVIPNPLGTAPGVYVPPRLGKDEPCAVFLLPGPPNELKPMFLEEVIPRVRALGEISGDRAMQEFRFVGVGESALQDQLDGPLHELKNLEVGYCAHLGAVDLRLIGAKDSLLQAQKLIETAYPTECFSSSGESLAAVVIASLREDSKTVCFAESCTGGGIAAKLTDIAGASSVFETGYVTYSNEAKMKMLGVSPELFPQYGAVSKEVAKAMASGALEKSGANYAISVTGIAGPGGGSDEKPVGTVWLALATRGKGVEAIRKFHPRGREAFREVVAMDALDLLRKALMGNCE